MNRVPTRESLIILSKFIKIALFYTCSRHTRSTVGLIDYKTYELKSKRSSPRTSPVTFITRRTASSVPLM